MTPIDWEKPVIPFPAGSPVYDGFSTKGEIHVWKASLIGWETRSAEFFAMLSAAEKERADRFRFSEHRQRFVCAHAIQRQILGVYCSVAPEAVGIQIDAAGKPFLKPAAEAEDRPLHFNLSHSDDLLLLSLSKSLATGVDVERIRLDTDEQVVSTHFFADPEQAWLANFPTGKKKQAFFKLWTCKEAVLKAEGSGIRRNLGEVPIEFTEMLETARCTLPGKHETGRSWSIRIFSPEPEYTAALAFENKASAALDPELKHYQWDG